MSSPASPSCLTCENFRHSPSEVEAAFPGLSSLSSAYATVRCDDGICARHERYVAASSSCDGWHALKSDARYP
jgi:hypothetical protein